MIVTVTQLENRLRKTLDSGQATQELTLAQAVVADHCNLVTLEQVEDDEVTLHGVYGPVLRIPGGPVESVSEVTIDGAAVSNYWLVKDDLWRGRNVDGLEVPLPGDLTTWVGPSVEVVVTCTHGFATGECPAAIQAVILGMAARTWSNPAGTRQQTIDGYSATWANGVLTSEDERALRRYHRSAYSADTS